MVSTITRTAYDFRVFVPRCELYALRFEGAAVTGVYGPLEYDEVLFSALPGFSYEDDLDRLAWVQGNLHDFVLFQTEYDENMLWI